MFRLNEEQQIDHLKADSHDKSNCAWPAVWRRSLERCNDEPAALLSGGSRPRMIRRNIRTSILNRQNQSIGSNEYHSVKGNFFSFEFC